MAAHARRSLAGALDSMRSMRMRKETLRVIFTSGILALATEPWWGAGTAAECPVTACFVEELRIVECRLASASKGPVQRFPGIGRRHARRVLSHTPAVFVRAVVQSSGPEVCLARAAAPSDPVALPGVNGENWFLVRTPTCEAYSPGAVLRQFVSSPCCDVMPTADPECLFDIQILKTVPGWVQDAESTHN